MTDNPLPLPFQIPNDLLSNYQRAKALLQFKFRGRKTIPNALVFPVWIEGAQCFWYERQLTQGKEFRLVNAVTATNTLAFNHQYLARALAEAVGQPVDAANLPINNLNGQVTATIEMTVNPVTLQFTAFDKRWVFIDESASLREIDRTPINELISPDGQKVLFTRDHNLWLRDINTNQERALTVDGEEFYPYAIPGSVYGNDAFVTLLPPQAQWSPDSRRLLTVQLDQRQVKTVGAIDHVPLDGSLRPKTNERKLAFPGDPYVECYRLLSIDTETGHIQDANYGQIPTTYGGAGGYFENSLGWWNTDSKTAYFVDVDRYYKYARVIAFDTDTGATRILFEEPSTTRIDLTVGPFDQAHLIPMPETDELLWYSDRSGWGHYYLYNLTTGQLKNPVTSGEWLVRDVVHYDAKRRELFVTTSGRETATEIGAQRDPYYRDLIRISINTGKITTLISTDHECITQHSKDIAQWLNGYVGTSNGVSPCGNYAVVTRSRVDEVPETFLLDRDGHKLMVVERADTKALPANWLWPEPVKMTAADGKTAIYGVIYKPSFFSTEETYPVIDQSFIGYAFPIAAKGAFACSNALGAQYFEAAAVAELGFIVVQIDGRGSRYRGKAFHDSAYGWLNSASHIDDHVAGIKQLAQRFSWMDLNRVGICGLNMGGNGVLEGLLKHPDFYTVGTCGQLYDARIMNANQGDYDEGETPRANEKYYEELVENLRGKLLLMVGLKDYVPPAVTFRVVEALQRANKDFDLIVEPNWGYTSSVYQTRRAWDYLVQHLQGKQPPKEFDLAAPTTKDS